MAQKVKWQKASGVTYDIGHINQKGFINPTDRDGLREYRIQLIVEAATRAAFQTKITNLLNQMRIRQLVIKTTNYGLKYIVPNGSQGYLITEAETTELVYPVNVEPQNPENVGAYVDCTFVRAL